MAQSPNFCQDASDEGAEALVGETVQRYSPPVRDRHPAGRAYGTKALEMLAGVEGRVNPRRYPGTELNARAGMFSRTQEPLRYACARDACPSQRPAERLQPTLNAFTHDVITPP